MLTCIPLAALLLDTALPYFLSQAIGTLAETNDSTLQNFLWLAGLAAILGVSLNLLGFQAAVRHESSVRADLANDVFNRLLAKDSSFFANQKIGALTGKFIDFVSAHIGLQDLFILRTLTFFIAMGSGIVIIFLNSELLGAVVLALLVGILLQIRVSLKLRRPLRQKRKQLVGEINGAAADAITNNMTVKTFGQEKYELNQFRELNFQYKRAHIKDFSWMSVEGSTRLAVMASMQIVAVIILSNLLRNGSIDLGTAIFTVAYLQRVATQLFTLGELINGYDKLFLQAAPMTEILLQDDVIKDKSNAKNIVFHNGKIKFANVSYSYSDAPNIPVIDNLTIVVQPGEKVGLVGHSGAGKTTLTKLLLRFADPNSGQILLDGIAIDSITQQSLRQSIAFVPQEPLLFHRSLKENIAYGKLEASDDEIYEAAKKANAYDFITKLAQGFDTVVGERGIKLSGGQRQRVAIARAILKNAPILVLDEATSALDSESEKLIQEALSELMKARTSIVIAHRLSTIAKLDRIIVIDQGKIIEDGTHQTLLHQNGTYAKLWRHQSGGFIEE